MKRLLTLLTLLSVCATSYALPLGNPLDATLLGNGVFLDGYGCDPCDPCPGMCDLFSFRLGYYHDRVDDRHLFEKGNPATSTVSGSVRVAELDTDAALLVANYCNRVDLFATLGTSRLIVVSNNLVGTPTLNFMTSTDFSWSVGGRVTAWEFGCLALGVEGQYFRSNLDLNTLGVQSVLTYPNRDITYEEWQVGAGAAYRVTIIPCALEVVPYIGVDWSNVCVDGFVTSATNFFPDMDEDRCVGYAVGITVVGASRWSLTLEQRFINERAFHFNTQFRF